MFEKSSPLTLSTFTKDGHTTSCIRIHKTIASLKNTYTTHSTCHDLGQQVQAESFKTHKQTELEKKQITPLDDILNSESTV